MLHCTAVARRLTHSVLAQRTPRFGPTFVSSSFQPQFVSITLVRRFSVPTGSPTPSTSSSTIAGKAVDNAPLPPSKKPKLDLRPAPIKPKPPSPSGGAKLPKAFTDAAAPSTSTGATSSSSSSKHPQHHVVPGTPSLGVAKEEALQDIHDAEAHGILKPPPPGASWFKRTLHQGIELFKFYYRGVKLIWSRRRAIAAINTRIKAGGPPLSRAEFRLIQTQKDDINKVIPFLIIALLLEEVIPLIAIYAPFMLPSTCILPSQRARIEAKRTEKALAFKDQYYHVYQDLKRQVTMAPPPPAAEGGDAVKVLRLEALKTPAAPTAVCGLLGLSTLGPDFLRVRRIRHRLALLTQDDDMLLANLQQVQTLRKRELVEALDERGIPNTEMAHKDLQNRLLMWLTAVKSTPAEDALSRRLALAVSLA